MRGTGQFLFGQISSVKTQPLSIYSPSLLDTSIAVILYSRQSNTFVKGERGTGRECFKDGLIESRNRRIGLHVVRRRSDIE